MENLYLPVLSHFQNGNIWTGSAGRLRYCLTPDGDLITAEVWEGPFSYAMSQIEETVSFPLKEEGLNTLAEWLQAWDTKINARPARSISETLQMRTVLAQQ